MLSSVAVPAKLKRLKKEVPAFSKVRLFPRTSMSKWVYENPIHRVQLTLIPLPKGKPWFVVRLLPRKTAPSYPYAYGRQVYAGTDFREAWNFVRWFCADAELTRGLKPFA